MAEQRKPVDELEGRELDAAVAEEVLGWTNIQWRLHDRAWENSRPYGWPEGHGGNDKVYLVPHYSTDIAAAWEVVERLRNLGFAVDIQVDPSGSDFSWVGLGEHTVGDAEYPDPCGSGDSVPIAICRVALKAVRSEE